MTTHNYNPFEDFGDPIDDDDVAGQPSAPNPNPPQGNPAPMPPPGSAQQSSQNTAQGGSPFGPVMMQMGAPDDDDDEVPSCLINYNERFANADPIWFRDTPMHSMLSVLISKLKPNPLLVGPAGVGKTKLVEELARMIAQESSHTPPQLQNSTIYELQLSSLVSGKSAVGQLEKELLGVIDFLKNPDNDAIVFIDEIHMLFDDRNPIYKNIAQMLKPELARGDIRVIGATTITEGRSIKHDPAMQRRFTQITVEELTQEQTLQILQAALPSYVAHHNDAVTAGDQVLRSIVEYADTYNRAKTHRPDNALTLLDRCLSSYLIEHGDLLERQVVDQLRLKPSFCKHTAITLQTGKNDYAEINIDALRDDLHANILGQTSAIDAVVEAIQRHSITSVFDDVKPLSFMFIGSSGVGKTHTAKIIAKHYSNEEPVFLNMASFSEAHAISKLIGSPAGYVGHDSNQELPLDVLAANPRRVIVLDEFEKAHKTTQRFFLSGLDEGYVTTAHGEVIDLSAAIIIATTNAGAKQLSKPQLGFGNALHATNLDQAIIKKALDRDFDREIVGRFNTLIGYSPIDEATYTDIVTMAYTKLRDRAIHKRPQSAYTLPETMDDAYLTEQVHTHYSVEHGARSAHRIAQRYIEDALLHH